MISKICLNCNSVFEIYPYRERTVKYCSKRCFNISKKGKFPEHLKDIIQKGKCLNTGRTHFKKEHIIWSKDLKGILQPNVKSFKKGHIPYNKGLKKKDVCMVCGKEMIVYRGEKYPKKHKTCSNECKIETIKRARIKQIITEKHKKAISNALKGRKLSKEHIAKISGSNNYHWNGGPDNPVKLLRGTFAYKQWRLAVYKRDYWTCQICGYKGKKIVANHIKKFKDYSELRFIITNGITICDACDNKLVKRHEIEWESYFNFNLATRGFIEDEILFIKIETNI